MTSEIAVRELAGLFRADAELAMALRFWTGALQLEIGPDVFTLTVADGRVTDFGPGRVDGAQISIAASLEAWDRQLEVVPAPFYQDPMMGTSRLMHELVISGDAIHDLFPYYAAVQRIVAIMREQRNTASNEHSRTDLPKVDRKFDSAVGRYVYLTIDEVQYRVYYEEAGEGIPLLCQHTAGSDGRQYRHQLEDAELQRDFRVIAYDLPYHGKSLPPTNIAWWKQEYELTQDFILKFVTEFCRALELVRPIFMGCSLGGVLAPDLAFYHPDLFRAVVALNSHVHIGVPAGSNSAVGYLSPRVSSGWKASSMSGIMAPGAPEAYRREIGWCYSQGAPAVLFGDLNYYHVEHDLRGKLSEIDTSRVAVYVVAGEYDPSVVGAGGSEAVAAGIAGAKYYKVAQGGHFLMAENPAEFRPLLLQILEEIRLRQDG